MPRNGEGSLPKVVVLESGVNFKIPSRQAGREISCRLFKPEDGQVKGVMMHLHSGGWVHRRRRMVGEKSEAELWGRSEIHRRRVMTSQVRLHVQWGAHLSVVTALHLHRTQPSFALKGLYELATLLPAVHHCDKNLTTDIPNIELCINSFLPDRTIEQRRDPSISPFYARLSRGALPPALLIVGTEDPSVDDSIMMAAKWKMNGNEAVLKLYPGAPHGFTVDPYSDAAMSLEDTKRFASGKME